MRVRFQSTPPRGGRRLRVHFAPGLVVSIHAPARGATASCPRSPSHSTRFNPRPRAGGDRRRSMSTASGTCFNPRPRAGGDPARFRWWLRLGCFNPRPRAGGDPSLAECIALGIVSIHAPARGATRDVRVFARGQEFQSTPPRGGRHPTSRPSGAGFRGFNPRPRAGGDQALHLLAHGGVGFNPRPRAGGDRWRAAWQARNWRFQSTPPRGGRLRACVPQQGHAGVSIHAPARGATCLRIIAIIVNRFQSTPPRGGRQAGACPLVLVTSFNPRPRAGGDMLLAFFLAALLCFNPRPRAGGDQLARAHGPQRGGFNPRPRAGGDCASNCSQLGWVAGPLCANLSREARKSSPGTRRLFLTL